MREEHAEQTCMGWGKVAGGLEQREAGLGEGGAEAARKPSEHR